MTAEGRQPWSRGTTAAAKPREHRPPEGGAGGQLKRVAAGRAQQVALQLWKLS